ncbi:MAG: outer membrane protein transport protein [Betaproteobacteria bacterium]|nr:outer membrane protein transport protein [Betaproteobacteria bacterium]
MRKILLAAATAAALAPCVALATDGYFSHGYGMKAKGRAGASTATTSDSFGGANNPATMVFAGSRTDLGVDWFQPDRSASRAGSTGLGFGNVDGAADGNGVSSFLIPEFGYNRMIAPDMSFGVTVYGNGGMNTEYSGDTIPAGRCGPAAANLLCGSGSLGVDLTQLIIAPTLARKIGGGQSSLGIAPLIAYQRFKAYGLQPFMAISSDPANLTNNGYDDSWGFGARFGYYAQLSPDVSFGAAYSTKINMQEFEKYRGLFAEHGDFDIPDNYNLGVAFKATPKLTVAADYQRINYSKVASVGNPSNQSGCAPTFPAGPGVGSGCLGASGSSIGFGWDDVSVIKLGVEYQWDSKLLLRAGYNRTDNPVQARDVTFNILAPGVVTDHLTLGFTYTLERGSEITMAYMHAFENSTSGPATNPYFNVGGTETLTMSQDSLGISWGWKF